MLFTHSLRTRFPAALLFMFIVSASADANQAQATSQVCRDLFTTSNQPHLNSTDISALDNYVRGYMYYINKRMRDGLKVTDTDCSGCLSLASALQKLPNFRGRVYRGIKNLPEEIYRQYLRLGETVEDPAFMSTTTDSRLVNWALKTTSSLAMVLVIESMTGKNLEAVSHHDSEWLAKFSHEREVLFLPGTRFSIYKIERDPETGNPIVFLREIE